MNIRSVLLIGLGVVLLASCSAPPATPPQGSAGSPAPTASIPVALGTLYQVSVRGVGDVMPSAQAQALSPQLRAQTLIGVPEPLTITGAPLYASSFTDKVKRVRHVQATFKVTNTSSRVLENLNFLPVVTSDTDGDATNNAATPTIAGTPFRSVQYFDGSDASARAAALTLAPGQLFNPSTGMVTTDPGASPFLTNLDVSQVVVAAPAGLSASVMSSGWRVAPALAPGESANVTFAADLQNADPATPKADPYAFTLLFTATADSAASAPAGQAISPALLRGTLNDSALPGGTAVLVNGVSRPSTTFNATSQVGAAGEVAIPLTTEPPSSDFFRAVPPQGDPCTYSGTVSDSSASLASYAGLLAASSGGDPVATVQEVLVSGATVPGAIVARLYARTPLEVHGKVSCSNRVYSITYDLSLKAGWNAVQVSGDNSALVFGPLASDARSVLKATRRTPGVTATFENTAVIDLKPGERVQRSVKLLQVGAYSGTVRLSTNVPGVSVEPATLNLAALGTQSVGSAGIGKQSLSTTLTFVAAADAPSHSWYAFTDALVLSDDSGKEVGRSGVNISLAAPGVSATLSEYSDINVSRDETTPVQVRLSSLNGLNGPVTVSLESLPQGVSAAPQTVQVTPGTTTTATIQLQVSGTAVLGSSTIRLVTSPANQATSGTQSSLIVLPARVLIGNTSIFGLYPAASGVWVVESEDGTTHSRSVRRYIDGVRQLTASFAVPDIATFSTVLEGRDGTLIAGRRDQEQFVVDTMQDDGSIKNVTTSQYIEDFYKYRTAVDAQGRIWFVNSPHSTSGPLGRYSPDGQTDTFNATTIYSDQSTFKISNSGRWLVISLSRYLYPPQPPVRIDTATGEVTILSTNTFDNGAFSFVVADDGTVWFISGNSTDAYLSRLNLDGSVTDFTDVRVNSLEGFDKTNPDILWLSAFRKLTRFSVSDRQQKTVAIQSNLNGFTLDPQGGVDYLSYEYQSGHNVYFLSRVK